MQLRPYQDEAINSLFSYFSTQDGNPLVAMPTGTGKSAVIAGFIQKALMAWPNTRVICLTHVKELVAQNTKALQRFWPNAPVGIYSAGLKQRDTAMAIIFAGVASIRNRVAEFGRRDLIIIDEAHLLSQSDSSMYQTIINEFKKTNPYVKVIGLTATPYRMGQGLLTNDGLFTDICFDITGMQAFNRLIDEGYLCPPYIHKTETEIDTSALSIAAGEFAKHALEVAADKVTLKCLQEMCYKAAACQSWLIFASGIHHAEKMAQILNTYGIPSAAVHSKITPQEREEYIEGLKSHKLRCLVNQNVLTTGFDFPPIDFIGMMRPTMSTGLWVQMIGRGTRPSPGKTGCLVLDFAGNARRLGPINDPYVPNPKGKGTGSPPVRICPQCSLYCAASARTCMYCGYEFGVAAPKLLHTADDAEVLKSDLPVIETVEVKRVFYSKKQKAGMPPYMHVSYSNGIQGFSEVVCLEHSGGARHKAKQWWHERHNSEPPATVDEALTYQAALKTPKFIRVVVNRKYPEIVGHEY